MSDHECCGGVSATTLAPEGSAVAPKGIDVVAVIDRAPIGRIHLLVLSICFVAALFDGFDLQAIAFTGPVIAQQWQIDPPALGVLFSAALVGMTMGALGIGLVGDHFGRKAALGLSVALFGVFTLAAAGATSYAELLVYRFLTGLGVGGAIPSVTTLAAEYAPARLRVMLIAVVSIGIPLGGVCGGVLAAQTIPIWGWESVFYVGGISPLLLLPVIGKMLPESLHFLVTKGGEKAKATVARLLSRIDPSGRYSERDCFVVPEVGRHGLALTHLFDRGLARNTLVLWLAFFANLLAMYFLMTWLPALLVGEGLVISKAINMSTLFSLGGAVGALVLAHLMGRYGSRRMLTWFFAIAALLCVVIIRLVGPSPLFLMGIIFSSGLLTISAQVGLNAMAAGIYPVSVRATGVGWALGIGRVGAITGPLIGGVLASLQLELQDYFLFFGLVLLLAAVGVALTRYTDPS
ncbi:MAG: MFS transporter [Candidatus Binatia bacterium]|nr:MFS transporter [Candidatus Binatia bacterium]